MKTLASIGEKSDIAQPSGAAANTTEYKKTRTRIVLIVLGVAAAIGLYFLFSHWHPLWRYQAGYVSEAQFGEDWPFNVSEAKVVCLGGGEKILVTGAGAFGLTGHAIAIGYKSLEESNIWKWDPNGWKGRVPADKFWIYVNTLCI